MDALITEAKNGDKEAFVRLIRMNKQSLYKNCLDLSFGMSRTLQMPLQNTILSCYEKYTETERAEVF